MIIRRRIVIYVKAWGNTLLPQSASLPLSMSLSYNRRDRGSRVWCAVYLIYVNLLLEEEYSNTTDFKFTQSIRINRNCVY
jgi:hypothetical protein